MTALVLVRHPLARPSVVHLPPGPLRIADHAPGWTSPFVALADGRPVLRAEWSTARHCTTLAFVDAGAFPAGPGGGSSNPLQMVLSLAVSVFAPGIGTYLAGQLGFNLATNSFGAVLVNGLSVLAGQALVNALIPPPKLPSTHSAPTPSPTYTLSAQGNQARLDAAIPEHFGRHIAYPDYAAQPYAEFVGNEQYLYQLFCLGRGEYDIEQIRVEDTPIASFDQITYEVAGPGEVVTLFPANVVTSLEVSGAVLKCWNATFTRTGTVITVHLVAHGLAIGDDVTFEPAPASGISGGIYTVTDVSSEDDFTFTHEGSGTVASNTCTVSLWVGPFVASAAETECNYLGVDFIMPRGLYKLAANGTLQTVSITVAVQSRRIDDNGDPVGGWSDLGVRVYSGATTTPQRYSERYAVTKARYEVRVRRTDVQQTDTATYAHEIAWTGLRAYLPDERTFGDCTVVAMRMQASNNLSTQASRKINFIMTRRLPVWDGTDWSANQATRSMAWALAYAAKQIGLTDAQISLADLLALDSEWSARGDWFDGRFDNFISFWEAATKLLAPGRAKPYMQAGVLRVVRDAPASIPVALYSMRNIVRGSFSVEYLMPTPDTADSVQVSYFDADSWTTRRVTATLKTSTATKPAKIELFGCTNRDQAYREGLYHAASNTYRRRIIRFQTEMEGFIPSLGDLIAVAHDMPAWGQSGEIAAWDAGTLEATTTEPLEWTDAADHYIGLRAQDGSVAGPYRVTPGQGPDRMVFDEAPPDPITSGTEERTHYAFGPGETWRLPARVTAVRPRGFNLVEIEAVNEDANVHLADQGKSAPVIQYSQLANYTNTPTVLGLTAISSPDNPDSMLLSWQPSPWAEYYLIEQSSDELLWTRSGEPTGSNYTCTALYGSATVVRVAAVGTAKGPWVTVHYGDIADYMWSQTPSDLMWSATDTDLMWRV